MISPHTPPGTKIVCINDAADAFRVSGVRYDGMLDGLQEGSVYTVVNILPAWISATGFTVVVAEISRPGCFHDFEHGFDIGRFRPAELPKCLTELLNTTPVRDKELAR